MLNEIVKENEDLLQEIKDELNMRKENKLALYRVNLIKLSDKTFDKLIEAAKEYLKIPFKVYSNYAFDSSYEKEATINFLYYIDLVRKYKIEEIEEDLIYKNPTEEDLKSDIIYSRTTCYLHSDYRIYKAPEELTRDEIALMLDEGNLCFGYTSIGSSYTVYED